MGQSVNSSVIFVSTASSVYGRTCLGVLIDSLRSFGGEIGQSPFWIFDSDPDHMLCKELEGEQVEVFPLHVPEPIRHYLFANKVFASAQAESSMAGKAGTLVWMDPICLVMNPPVLYDLGEAYDVALRPVHIRNVGLRVDVPLDAFWQGVYKTVGTPDAAFTVESFVDQQRLRVYFNSHAFAVNPSLGLMQHWLEGFQTLVCDQEFQASACQDEAHQIFLFQALLSTLLATSIDRKRIRILPPTYNYPYNLQQSLPPERRAKTLNELVSCTYEDRLINPAVVADIEIEEPLRTWLLSREEINALTG